MLASFGVIGRLVTRSPRRDRSVQTAGRDGGGEGQQFPLGGRLRDPCEDPDLGERQLVVAERLVDEWEVLQGAADA